jgi:hypothetical protein
LHWLIHVDWKGILVADVTDLLVIVVVEDAAQNAMAGQYNSRLLDPREVHLVQDGRVSVVRKDRERPQTPRRREV